MLAGTPTDLNTSDQTTTDDGSGDAFDSIVGNVLTLAGAGIQVAHAVNSPAPNNTPSNVPSPVPTQPAPLTSTFAGWSTTKKIVVGFVAVVGVILAGLGLKKLFSKG